MKLWYTYTPAMSQNSDLSAYERVRLENIRKNNEFLAQLGLFPPAPAPKPKVTATAGDRLVQEKRKRTRQEQESSLEPRRRSSRLSGSSLPEDILSLDEPSGKQQQVASEIIPFYDRIAQESDELDDFEFQAFVELRKWRLLRARELDLEPYKIFQNRTFCDMVRRRRNDPNWAVNVAGTTEGGQSKSNDETFVPNETIRSSPAPSQETSTTSTRSTLVSNMAVMASGTIDEGHENETIENTNTPEQPPDDIDIVRYDPALIDVLTDCFGIAAGKTRKGGFAWEALAALNRKKVALLLEQSRLLQPGLTEN